MDLKTRFGCGQWGRVAVFARLRFNFLRPGCINVDFGLPAKNPPLPSAAAAALPGRGAVFDQLHAVKVPTIKAVAAVDAESKANDDCLAWVGEPLQRYLRLAPRTANGASVRSVKGPTAGKRIGVAVGCCFQP